MDNFIEIKSVYKNYALGKAIVEVLKGVDMSIRKGEWLALLGASGSGKTTLLDIIGTLAKPDSGTIAIDGTEYSTLTKRKQARFRGSKVGFIFQAYHMFPELNILENVLLPAKLANNRNSSPAKAKELLECVGLADRISHRPNELSGGEQQRVAIARSLINDPEVILADEPTGNLDSLTGNGILDIFKELHSHVSGRTIVMVTHDHSVADLADRIVHLKDGKIVTAN